MPITYVIIAVTVLISWSAFNRPQLIERFILNPYRAEVNKEYYRFLTSGFVHGSFPHLLWNMFTLYFFGGVVEQYFHFIFGRAGAIYFVALYLIAIVVSDIPTFFKRRHDPGYNSLGASGGVAAIVFVSILLQPTEYICFYIFLCMPGFLLGAAFIVWSYVSSKRPDSRINHEAHLYGALFGLVFCIVLYPESLPRFIEQIAQWSLFD